MGACFVSVAIIGATHWSLYITHNMSINDLEHCAKINLTAVRREHCEKLEQTVKTP